MLIFFMDMQGQVVQQFIQYAAADGRAVPKPSMVAVCRYRPVGLSGTCLFECMIRDGIRHGIRLVIMHSVRHSRSSSSTEQLWGENQ